MIGLIFPKHKLNRIIKGREKRENMQFYRTLAEAYQIDLLLYSLSGLNAKKRSVTGYLYSYQGQTIQQKQLELPKVNLFRTVLYRSSTYHMLKQLEKNHQILFINLVPPRNKYKIYEYLKRKERLSDHIPHTELLTFKSLLRFLKKYKKVIIKPYNGAFGERVYLLQKINNMYFIIYTYRKRQHVLYFHANQLYFYYLHYFSHYPYLIQPWIPLKKVEGNKLDIRTSIQKNRDGDWNMTGIVGRVAGKRKIVTNMAQGGRAVVYKELLEYLNVETMESIKQLSINVAKELEELYPSIADLGLDIGIDKEDNLWFIEANFCDERYTYRDAGEEEMWYASYKFPFEYAFSRYSNI